MSDFFIQVFCGENESYSLIIEDDGRVCYAYLLQRDDIIGDVWLYNQEDTPLIVNWQKTEEMPFLNPKEFVKTNLSPIQNEDEINLNWFLSEDKMLLQAVEIQINQKPTAKISEGALPGWSKNVNKDGPLAMVW